jgi:hypothetical protein
MHFICLRAHAWLCGPVAPNGSTPKPLSCPHTPQFCKHPGQWCMMSIHILMTTTTSHTTTMQQPDLKLEKKVDITTCPIYLGSNRENQSYLSSHLWQFLHPATQIEFIV